MTCIFKLYLYVYFLISSTKRVTKKKLLILSVLDSNFISMLQGWIQERRKEGAKLKSVYLHRIAVIYMSLMFISQTNLNMYENEILKLYVSN